MKSKLLSALLSSFFTLILFWNHAQAATITVTEKNDSFGMGNCSLRDAVEMVNSMGAAAGTGCVFSGAFGSNDTINLEAGTYTVSLDTTDENMNVDGDIDVLQPVLIQGAGMDATHVTGAFAATEADRIFQTNIAEGEVIFRDLTVSNGGSDMTSVTGAGIENISTALILQRVHVRDNIGSTGGGIHNSGNLVLLQSRVTGNVATSGGGGISSNDTLAINESTIDNNEAAFGGGIYNGADPGNSFLVYNSTVSRNRATGGPNAGNGSGGGIYIFFSDATSIIVNSTISTNEAGDAGGGIFVCSQCADSAGGVVEGTGSEPGVFLLNDTITLNEVLSPNGEGGGIYFDPQNGGQILSDGVGATGSGGAVNLANTLLAQNQADVGPDCFSELFSSPGFNLLGDTTGCDLINLDPVTSPDKLNEDPRLGMLQDNGGPTFTHGLFDDSPAIDMANNNQGCQAPDFDAILDSLDFTNVPLMRDQRNFPRPIAVLDPNDPICDIGAFEFQVFDFVVTKDDGLDGEEIPVGTTFDYTITVTNNGPGAATAVTLDDPLPSGMDFISVNTSQGACAAIGEVIGCDLGDLGVGETATITVTVIATEEGTFTNIVTITLNNPFQQQLTETAQVTTVVGGSLFVFGSGFHCEFHPGAVGFAPKGAHYGVLGLMALLVLASYTVLRRRTCSRGL
jgi:uncharacterized repeat protein (TIGR01451 family)